jgi:uncharacterized protein YutE (UPF0331/DUF86 family)
MVDADLVGRKIAIARSRLADADQLREQAQRGGTTHDRDLASFYVFLAIQEAIDLAAHWVADAGWPPPDEAGGAFDVLADRGAIERDLADAMRKAVGLRNRIAHGYGAVDHERLFREMRDGSRELRRFLARVAAAAGL